MTPSHQTSGASTSLHPAIIADDLRGFKVWSHPVRIMSQSHMHTDIEINFVLSGEVEYFFAGRFETWNENSLAAFWAGIPHALRRVGPGTEMLWCIVPLVWFLQWSLPDRAMEMLLRGQVLVKRESGDLLRTMMLRWSREFGDLHSPRANAEDRKIIALEVEALLRRLVRDAGDATIQKRRSTSDAGTSASQIGRLTAFISQHYCEEITAREIAAAVDLHPNYAMQLFRERCGLSLWEYVLRLRVSHAQYLLLTTHRKMSDIARASGFVSESRFYAAFEKYCGLAPRAWREASIK